MLFPVAPEVLHRVEFWRVSGQTLQFESGPLAGDPVLDQATAVSGKAVPVEMILQHRGLSARRPRAAAVGSLAQPALVDEDDGLARPAGFFLSWGQRYCFQRWMACSSRSSARPAGRWQLQPNCPSRRQTCAGW